MEIERINGQKTGVLRIGSGAPALFLHCALARAQALQGLIQTFKKDWAIKAPDLPGHGQSEFDTRLDIQDQAVASAVTLLQQNDDKAHLFGHSFGATVALRIALLHPKLVKSLTLFEPVYFSLLAVTNPKAYAQEKEASFAFSTAAIAGNWPAAARAFLSRWSAESFDDLQAPQKAYILKTIPLILASEQSIIAPDSGRLILNGLNNLALPVLLIRGGESPQVTRHINATLASRIPQARSVVIDGAGHMGPITHTRLVADEIWAHLTANKCQ